MLFYSINVTNLVLLQIVLIGYIIYLLILQIIIIKSMVLDFVIYARKININSGIYIIFMFITFCVGDNNSVSEPLHKMVEEK